MYNVYSAPHPLTPFPSVPMSSPSPLSSSPLMCYHCSARNIFTLGFVPAREESTVVLLCRNCCDVKEMKEMSWDVKSWTSLIHDRKLLTWLAPMPSEGALVRAREIR